MAARVIVDPDGMRAAYEDVRDDNSETQWCLFGYDNDGAGKKIESINAGVDYSELVDALADDLRLYAYARFETGDEMSRRAKFVFITWIGPGVSPLKKAKVSTDKAFVKEQWPQFGKELLADEKNDIKYDKVLKVLEAASGAAYGTGK